MNTKTEGNPKGAGCMRKMSPRQEQLIFQRHRAGVPPYEILNEFKISDRTYIRILSRLYAEINRARNPIG